MNILKVTLILILLAKVFVQINAVAQVASNTPISVNHKGVIKKDGLKIGFISKKKTVFDANGKKIAYMYGPGNLIETNGKKVCRIGEVGNTFENYDGDLILKIKSNGSDYQVFDSEENYIGNIHSKYKELACVLYCFQEDLDTKSHKSMEGDVNFTCPMHQTVSGKKGDSCQICGMSLIKASKK